MKKKPGGKRLLDGGRFEFWRVVPGTVNTDTLAAVLRAFAIRRTCALAMERAQRKQPSLFEQVFGPRVRRAMWP